GFAKTLGAGKIAVTSSGLEAAKVHPGAIEVMGEIGINITDQTSKSIRDFNPEDYDAVISLCGCGVNLPEGWVLQEIFEDWLIDDPDGQPMETFRRVRDEIKAKVVGLIEQLSR
ncbi:MAG: arsenate reductase, glutathione/glutaredoxin type, partial [Microcystis sp.]